MLIRNPIRLSLLHTFSLLFIAGCGVNPTTATLEGLSADSNADNRAILVQGNVREAVNDIGLLQDVLADEDGDYRFEVDTALGATTSSAIQAIGQAASEVSEDGTLFIYLGGHGSPDGGSQMNDGRLLYYRQIRSALEENVESSFRRLVLVVFGCYSGSWINNIDRVGDTPSPETLNQVTTDGLMEAFAESNAVYDELLVMTSSSSGQLSYYTPGRTSHFIDAFSRAYTDLKGDVYGASIDDLVRGTQSRVRSSNVMAGVFPTRLSDEPLFNSAM